MQIRPLVNWVPVAKTDTLSTLISDSNFLIRSILEWQASLIRGMDIERTDKEKKGVIK